jgi:hypothetical protein
LVFLRVRPESLPEKLLTAEIAEKRPEVAEKGNIRFYSP